MVSCQHKTPIRDKTSRRRTLRIGARKTRAKNRQAAPKSAGPRADHGRGRRSWGNVVGGKFDLFAPRGNLFPFSFFSGFFSFFLLESRLLKRAGSLLVE